MNVMKRNKRNERNVFSQLPFYNNTSFSLQKDSHLLPEFRAGQNGVASFDPQLPLSRSSMSASRNSSMSPASAAMRRLPHDIAKEGDNYLAPEEMPLSIWIEIEIHQVEDPENVFFQGGKLT